MFGSSQKAHAALATAAVHGTIAFEQTRDLIHQLVAATNDGALRAQAPQLINVRFHVAYFTWINVLRTHDMSC